MDNRGWVQGFKPNMYWLMLKSGTSFSSSAEFLPRYTLLHYLQAGLHELVIVHELNLNVIIYRLLPFASSKLAVVY